MAVYPLLALLLVLLLGNAAVPGFCCYTSIFCFGDSISDTGNILHLNRSHHVNKYPYGMTYFHHPTGRASDGRLIIDFIAEYLGFPLLPPYFRVRKGQDYRRGVNFAVVGAAALDSNFFENRNLYTPYANYSLSNQLEWFKEFMPSLCDPSSDCRDFFSKSLFVMGGFGGNDYYFPFRAGRSYNEIQSFVPLVINATSEAIQTLMKSGAQTFMVPGHFPFGCLPEYLTMFRSLNKELYNPETGCLNWLNEFAVYHNDLLQKELDRLRKLHPHTSIIYADYYNAIMPFYLSPTKFGFSKEVLSACCGGGGPYNFNFSALCGESNSHTRDPSLYADWDGFHPTEVAYKIIATGLLDGSYVFPPLNMSCLESAVAVENVGFDPK